MRCFNSDATHMRILSHLKRVDSLDQGNSIAGGVPCFIVWVFGGSLAVLRYPSDVALSWSHSAAILVYSGRNSRSIARVASSRVLSAQTKITARHPVGGS